MGAVMQQRIPSYDIGFTTGVKYAEHTKGHMLSSSEMPVAVHNYYVQASRAISVDQAYFDGII